jgi:hypothetical protein
VTDNQIVALAADTIFQGQVRTAAISYAQTVLGQASSGHNNLDFKRYSLAQTTIADGCQANLTKFVWGIASLSGFSAATNDTTDQNDAAIASAMITAWNDLAGVTSTDATN